MNRLQLYELHPALYVEFRILADRYSLWEKVLMTFESYRVPLDATARCVRHDLGLACFVWDIL